MAATLGISVGAAGVGATLLVDTPTGPTTRYRMLAADPDEQREPGDLVFDAVALMTHGDDVPVRLDTLTVAYRTDEESESVHAAATRRGRLVRMVPDTAALLTYLHTAGLRTEPGAVAVVDIGASGTTASVLDRRTGTVLRSARTSDIGGAALTSLIVRHVRAAVDGNRTRRQIAEDLLWARCQAAQELLTTSESARIDFPEAGAGTHVTLTRADLTALARELADTLAEFTRQVCFRTRPEPDALAVVGAAAVPVLTGRLVEQFDREIVPVPDPAAAASHGAALLAASSTFGGYRLVGAARSSRGGRRMSGAIAAALGLGVVLAGLATDGFTDLPTSDAPVSPAGTSELVETEAPTTVPTPAPVTGTDIPSRDPDHSLTPTPVHDTPDQLSGYPLPVPPATTSRAAETTTSLGEPTVTPTPIEQVPTPENSVPDAGSSGSDRPSWQWPWPDLFPDPPAPSTDSETPSPTPDPSDASETPATPDPTDLDSETPVPPEIGISPAPPSVTTPNTGKPAVTSPPPVESPLESPSPPAEPSPTSEESTPTVDPAG